MMARLISISTLLLTLAFVFTNCSGNQEDATPDFPFSNSLRYFQQSAKVSLEVHYEPGAEPFVGNTVQGRAYWSILEENLAAIFQYRQQPPQLEVPKTLAAMHAMPVQGRSEWTTADILALHQSRLLSTPTASEARFYVFFVKGHYSTGTGPQTGVIGVHVGSTPIIAIFKEVIQNSGMNPAGPAAKFVEQSTLVHEMGHALGFVDRGVPMAAAHSDAAHPGHTTNQNCVMYWLNEGVSDLQAFVQQYLVSASVIMWGPEVMADAQTLSR